MANPRGDMERYVHRPSIAVTEFHWLLTRFVSETPGVRAAVAVSAEGLLIAMSESWLRVDAERMAAVTSAMMTLATGAGRLHDLGPAGKAIIEFNRGYLLAVDISLGAALGVSAEKESRLGVLAYEMARFANRIGPVLTHELIEELKADMAAR